MRIQTRHSKNQASTLTLNKPNLLSAIKKKKYIYFCIICLFCKEPASYCVYVVAEHPQLALLGLFLYKWMAVVPLIGRFVGCGYLSLVKCVYLPVGGSDGWSVEIIELVIT